VNIREEYNKAMLSVGTILKKEREKKGLLLIDIEKQIKVREKYLKAIEEENWNFFSSKIYITGILKNYSRVLNLDHKKILAFFRRDYEKKEEVKFNRKVSSDYLTSETKKFFKLGLIILVLFFIGYFIYQLKIYFSPPGFILLTPKVKNFTIEKSIKISGKTDRDTAVVIAGERIYQNKDGVFTYSYSLNEGENKLIINLTGANGKKTLVKETFFKKTPR
jgi:cytoskeletal protein RodZ